MSALQGTCMPCWHRHQLREARPTTFNQCWRSRVPGRKVTLLLARELSLKKWGKRSTLIAVIERERCSQVEVMTPSCIGDW
jgi:hypothetical protein